MTKQATIVSRWGTLLCAAALMGAAPGLAADDAVTYPNRPIHIIVPFAPAGATDLAVRMIQGGLSQALGQQVVIDNRPGAAGNIGMEAAARATPDGYTLFFGNVGTVSINPYFFPDLTVVPERDFEPVSLASETPGILIASNKFPPNSLKEMIDYVKARPGKVNYASSGVSTLNTLEMEAFRRANGLAMTQVPYKGGAGPAIADLIGGHVDVMFVTVSAAVAHVKTGQLKAYAVTTRERVALVPDVPTIVELGHPENVSTSWQGLFALAGTPKPIIAKLHAAVVQAMADPKVREMMIQGGMLPTTSPSPQAFKAYVAADSAKWQKVVKETGAKPE